jgi:hypothetical protein
MCLPDSISTSIMTHEIDPQIHARKREALSVGAPPAEARAVCKPNRRSSRSNFPHPARETRAFQKTGCTDPMACTNHFTAYGKGREDWLADMDSNHE